MPEKPEVITVTKRLKEKVLNKKIKKVKVLYNNIIEGISVNDFEKKLVNQTIYDITTRGKWIVFHLDDYLLLAHLRMEGKFFIRNENDDIEKHQHVLITFDDSVELRFSDVRKFGRMMLLDKDNYINEKPFTELGLEFDDKNLTSTYLLDKFKKKSLPIKTVLLDQSIITGIGNIYADEILYLSKIHPLIPAKCLEKDKLNKIIDNTRIVLKQAIKEGGTTIRSYTSEEGVKGNFQNNLYVHQRKDEKCRNCDTIIEKIVVGGRGTYFCKNCQKELKN